MSPSFLLSLGVALLLALASADTNLEHHQDSEQPRQGQAPQYSTELMDIIQLDNGLKYFFSKNQVMTWMEAMSFCLAFNMDLTSIESQEENDLIMAQLASIGMSNKYFWCSGNKIGRGSHMWLTGSSMVYTDWQSNHPGNFVCMVLYTGNWWGYNCENNAYPICEERRM